VLPSPNGSAIAYHIADRGGICVAACLRNAAAVGAWIRAHHDSAQTSVAVIAAGERWPDGRLRPALEDAWGSGAVIEELVSDGWASLSPEAASARTAREGIRDVEHEALLSCVSGRELLELGFRNDVDIAAEVESSRCVPVLRAGRFVDAG
jgi:2-phosphosulfolactate phosphatase